MKRWLYIPVIFALAVVPALSNELKRRPENLSMTLAWMADAGKPNQYVFVINGVVAYQTIDGLKKYLEGCPAGSRLTWAPGCGRKGGEPLLSSKEEMALFKTFCKTREIDFVLTPSG